MSLLENVELVGLPRGLQVFIGKEPINYYTLHEVFYLLAYDCLNLTRNDIVLDCGANIGCFTLWASQYAHKIVSVEPLQENYDLLCKNITLNNLDSQVIPVKQAIFNKFQDMKLYTRLKATATLISKHGHGKFETVSCTQIDCLEKRLGFSFSVLKLDVEGAEWHALDGASHCLPHVREVALEYHSQALQEQCVDVLTRYGFDVETYQPKNRFSWHWLKGYVLLNYRRLKKGRRPALMEHLSQSKSKGEGILYARRTT